MLFFYFIFAEKFVMETMVKEKESLTRKVLVTNFSINRNRKTLKDLKGKISFRDDYNYKSMRG